MVKSTQSILWRACRCGQFVGTRIGVVGFFVVLVSLVIAGRDGRELGCCDIAEAGGLQHVIVRHGLAEASPARDHILEDTCESEYTYEGDTGDLYNGAAAATIGYPFSPQGSSSHLSSDSLGRRLPGRIFIEAFYAPNVTSDDLYMLIELDPSKNTLTLNNTAEKFPPHITILDPGPPRCSLISYDHYRIKVAFPRSIVAGGNPHEYFSSRATSLPITDEVKFRGFSWPRCEPVEGTRSFADFVNNCGSPSYPSYTLDARAKPFLHPQLSLPFIVSNEISLGKVIRQH